MVAKGFTVNLDKPPVFQAGHLGEEYHDWIHQLILGKIGESVLFGEADREINLVYEGGCIGLMGLIAKAVHEGGCHVLGDCCLRRSPSTSYVGYWKFDNSNIQCLWGSASYKP